MLFFSRVFFCVALVFAVVRPALAENFALLIGASSYPSLDEQYWLKGPANDVDLVARYLTDNPASPFQPDNITILADGLAGHQAPTLAAIRTAFGDLAARAGPGDMVYLQFSGHGSQVPARDPASELDGLDEVFLPVDIGPWLPEAAAIENALVDDEIGQLIGAIRARGAHVWAVFDACHSGTVTRGVPAADDAVRFRKLAPAVLDVPAVSVARALPDPRQRPESPLPGEGGFVAFFAAQTNETTIELRLPKGAPDRRVQGVFTFVIFEILAQNPGITYRQLAQEVLRRYAVYNLARATPMFEGDLDRVVLSGVGTDGVAQWPVSVVDGVATIPAGMLHNLRNGDDLLLMAGAGDSDAAALSRFRVVKADTFSAEVGAVAVAGLPAVAADDIPRGAYLRRIGASVDFTLTVALPPDAPGSEALDKLTDALAILRQSSDRVRFVPAGAEADMRLAILPDSSRPDAVWFLPGAGYFSDGDAVSTPSIGTVGRSPDDLAALIGDNVRRIARATNLLRIGAGMGVPGLDVAVSLRTRNASDQALRTLDAAAVPRLVPGDEVHVRAKNNSDGPVDINVLYVGSDYAISHFFAGRLQKGDVLQKGLFRITGTSLGRERVVLVISPARAQSIVEDLSFLAQDALPANRGAAQSGLAGLLAEAGFGQTTRGAMALDDPDTGAGGDILQFEIDTVPGN